MEMEMSEVLERVGGLINGFAVLARRKCGLDFDEGQQQLMIKAWKASKDFIPEIHQSTFEKYAKTILYFETWHIIQKEARTYKLKKRAIERLTDQEPTEIPDIMDLIVDRVAYQQIVARLPKKEERAHKLRMVGYNLREISDKVDRSLTWVSKALTKKVTWM